MPAAVCNSTWCRQLLLAIRKGELPRVLSILEEQSQANGNVIILEGLKDTSDGCSLLLCATLSGNVALMELIYLYAPQSADDVSKYGWGLLHCAVMSKRIEAVRWAISNVGASMDEKDNAGLTPLYYAAINNSQDLVHLLISHGADVNNIDLGGSSLLQNVISVGSIEMIKLLLFQFSANGGYLGSSVTCDLIQTALYSRREDVVLFFILDYGIDVNNILQNGSTPLHWAASTGDLSLTKALVLQCGANISIKNKVINGIEQYSLMDLIKRYYGL